MAEAEQEAATEIEQMQQMEDPAGDQVTGNDDSENQELNEDENNVNDEEHEQDVTEETEGINGDSGDAVDTTAEFLKIFQGKTEFNSWEEFNTLFEEFQRETGSGEDIY